MVDSLKWAPRGFATWIFERDQRPEMVNLRENRTYAHELAAKLIEEKREELKNGTSRRDVLSLLGSSCIHFMEFDMRYNNQFFSQGKLFLATRLATKLWRNRFPSSVRQRDGPLSRIILNMAQDDYVCGARNYVENGQLFRTIWPALRLDQRRS